MNIINDIIKMKNIFFIIQIFKIFKNMKNLNLETKKV